MDFEHFKRDVAMHYGVDIDTAMQTLDESNPEAMMMVELLETGSVSVKLGERSFVLSVKVEEEL